MLGVAEPAARRPLLARPAGREPEQEERPRIVVLVDEHGRPGARPPQDPDFAGGLIRAAAGDDRRPRADHPVEMVVEAAGVTAGDRLLELERCRPLERDDAALAGGFDPLDPHRGLEEDPLARASGRVVASRNWRRRVGALPHRSPRTEHTQRGDRQPERHHPAPHVWRTVDTPKPCHPSTPHLYPSRSFIGVGLDRRHENLTLAVSGVRANLSRRSGPGQSVNSWMSVARPGSNRDEHESAATHFDLFRACEGHRRVDSEVTATWRGKINPCPAARQRLRSARSDSSAPIVASIGCGGRRQTSRPIGAARSSTTSPRSSRRTSPAS